MKIAERTGVDLYWLLTGKTKPEVAIAAGHPLVQRVAQLLADKPDSAAPLAAFLEILAGVQAFPASQVPGGLPPQAEVGTPVGAAAAGPEMIPAKKGGKAPAAVVAEIPAASGEQAACGELSRTARESWVPILGRTAAGVAHFWAHPEDSAGVTMLEDLVERYCRAPLGSARPAAVAEPGAVAETTVQVITMPGGVNLEAAEFIAAPTVKARYDDAFALRVDGDSMAPDIRHGDIVILSPSVPAAEGRPAVVQLSWQIGVICKLYRRMGQQVHLIPINEQFAPQTHPISKIQWALAVLARVRV